MITATRWGEIATDAWRQAPTWAQPAQALRILVVGPNAQSSSSGLEHTLHRLRGGLLQRGHMVDRVSPDWLRQTTRALRRYDVLHINGPASQVRDHVGLLRLARADGPAVVYTHHSDAEVLPRNGLDAGLRWLRLHLVHQLPEHVVITSDTPVRTASAAGRRPTAIIPLGTDMPGPALRGRRPFTVVCAASSRAAELSAQVRAMSHVHGAHIVVLGDARMSIGQASSKRTGFEFHEEWSLAAIRALCRRADVVVVPEAGAGLTRLLLLEAMAAGCVPVVADIARHRGLIGRIGFEYPARGAEALADVLRLLRDRPRLAHAIGERARARAAEFSWDRAVDQYAQLFHHAVTMQVLRTSGSDQMAAGLSTVRAQRSDSADDDPRVTPGAPLAGS